MPYVFKPRILRKNRRYRWRHPDSAGKDFWEFGVARGDQARKLTSFVAGFPTVGNSARPRDEIVSRVQEEHVSPNRTLDSSFSSASRLLRSTPDECEFVGVGSLRPRLSIKGMTSIDSLEYEVPTLMSL